MHRNVEVLIGRLATDATLRKRFAGDPGGLLSELTGRGFDLTPVEVDALRGLPPEALLAFADALDRRLRRAMTETTNHREEI